MKSFDVEFETPNEVQFKDGSVGSDRSSILAVEENWTGNDLQKILMNMLQRSIYFRS